MTQSLLKPADHSLPTAMYLWPRLDKLVDLDESILGQDRHRREVSCLNSLQPSFSLRAYGLEASTAARRRSTSSRLAMSNHASPDADRPAKRKRKAPTAVPHWQIETEAGPSGSGWYLPHLDRHIQLSRAHTLGLHSLDAQGPSYQFGRSIPLAPSNTLWTPNDKALFYHSISLHSRLRPDLIALDTGKSEIDVVRYLDVLQRCDLALQGGRRREKRWKGSHQFKRGLAASARQVSPKWIEREDALALHVENFVGQVERERGEALKTRTRRRERLEMLRTSVEKLPVGRTRRVTTATTKELERRWELQDWGDELDGEKMERLDEMLVPMWSRWYHARLVQDTSVKQEVDAESESEGPNVPDAIQQDAQALERLLAIPKRDRTPDERAAVTAIQNRKRNRERYRRNLLVKEGMTAEAIESAGGPDAIFEQRKNKRSGGWKRGPRLATMDMAVQPSEMSRYMAEMGWEVFNYDRMGQLLRALHPTAEHPSISFTILEHLYTEFTAFLVPLVHRSIVLAEQAATHPPDLGQDFVTEDGEIDAKVVYQAIALGSDQQPHDTVVGLATRVFGEKDGGSPGDDGTGSSGATGEEWKKRRWNSYPLPPGDLSWYKLPLSASTQAKEDDTMDWETKTSTTDAEDDRLDELLDMMDEMYDAVLEEKLWTALEAEEAGEWVDWDDVFCGKTAVGASGEAEGRRTRMVRMDIPELPEEGEGEGGEGTKRRRRIPSLAAIAATEPEPESHDEKEAEGLPPYDKAVAAQNREWKRMKGQGVDSYI
ncbi:hypothetical protein P7C73_g4695, partial [Tremellales sp. Uapishka_1]